MFSKFKIAFNQYPKSFKVLTFATFIDQLGTFLLYPFFSIYIINRFNVGMTEVGLILSIFSAGGIFGGIFGGALADKYGRRKILLIGLIVSGVGNIFMGLVDNLIALCILALLLGLIGNLGGPARQAMVADLLPKERQTEGFGVLRVAFNISATIGPIIGGLLAGYSFMILFIGDAVFSFITGLIVFFVIPETKPKKLDDKPEESIIKTIIGYKEVLKDWVYILFLSVSMVMVLVYIQMNSTLSVFLNKYHNFPTDYFGLLLSMNAIMVVLFQFWIAKKISKYDPMKMMTFGTLFYLIGFGMYGFVSEVYLFFVAMALITIGEMIVTPIGTSAAALFAPEDKRGRYMAMFGFSWAIPSLFGLILAGLVMDKIGPNWVWYFAGILSLITMIGFWLLRGVANERFSKEKELLNIKLEQNQVEYSTSETS